jgi:hypothetical protein
MDCYSPGLAKNHTNFVHNQTSAYQFLPSWAPTDDKKQSPPPDVICQSIECQQPPKEQKPSKDTPDESCIFNPTQKKCAPDNQGNCPPGFGDNSKDQCSPTHKCPPGFAREDNDESGACKKIKIICPPGFEVKKGVCSKDIIINIIKRIKTDSSSSTPGTVTMSKVCYDVINVLWNAGKKKDQDKKIDDFIAGCLK